MARKGPGCRFSGATLTPARVNMRGLVKLHLQKGRNALWRQNVRSCRILWRKKQDRRGYSTRSGSAIAEIWLTTSLNPVVLYTERILSTLAPSPQTCMTTNRRTRRTNTVYGEPGTIVWLIPCVKAVHSLVGLVHVCTVNDFFLDKHITDTHLLSLSLPCRYPRFMDKHVYIRSVQGTHALLHSLQIQSRVGD